MSMKEWLPIETAPRDRTRILGCQKLEWLSTQVAVTYFGYCHWLREFDEELPYWNPTHWMPLPEPPQ